MIRTIGCALLILGITFAIGCASGGGGGGGPSSQNANAVGNENANESTPSEANENGSDAGAAFTLTSQSIEPFGVIGLRFALDVQCGGENVRPHLAWSGAPEGTESYLVIVLDTDVEPAFVHWVVFDVPAGTLQIPEGGLVPGQETLNGYALFGYGGPCPPSGDEHTYVFRVYALDVADVPLTAGQAATLADVEDAIEGHVLVQAEFQATYTGP